MKTREQEKREIIAAAQSWGVSQWVRAEEEACGTPWSALCVTINSLVEEVTELRDNPPYIVREVPAPVVLSKKARDFLRMSASSNLAFWVEKQGGAIPDGFAAVAVGQINPVVREIKTAIEKASKIEEQKSDDGPLDGYAFSPAMMWAGLRVNDPAIRAACWETMARSEQENASKFAKNATYWEGVARSMQTAVGCVSESCASLEAKLKEADAKAEAMKQELAAANAKIEIQRQHLCTLKRAIGGIARATRDAIEKAGI